MKCWLFVFLASSVSLFAKTELVFWHSFEGFLYDQFSEIVDDFNHLSKGYHVKLVYKGNYAETFNRGLSAAEEGNPPHILQVYEVATLTMMLKPEIFRPVDEMMRHYFKKFDTDIYIDAVRDFYSTSDNKMFSLPWNASTGILFYNKKAFKKAGLDPERPPKTWEELEVVGSKLVSAGYKGFVTAWPVAYHLEHLCSWHNLPFATKGNGFGGLDARLNFNQQYQQRHLSKLVEWQKNGIFNYQGRFTKEPESFFAAGKSGMILQGANRLSLLQQNSEDPIGVGFMPYWSDIDNAPFRLNIGGSAFWSMAGFDEDIYRGIAHFFSYLSLTEVQAHWHQKTSYLPITEAAYYLTKKKGFYKENPAAEIAVLEVMNPNNTPYTRGIRLGNYVTVREKILDFLEEAIEQKITPKEALDKAVDEGNLLLFEYEAQHIQSQDQK